MKHILLFLGVFISTALLAQPTITQADLIPLVGASALSDSVSYVDLSSQVGINQTWDLSGLTSIGPAYTYNWINPASAAGESNFPTANYAVVVDFLTFFYDISNNEYNEIGYYLEFGGNAVMETFSNPAVRFEFPMQYGGSGSDTYESTMEFGGVFAINSTGSLDWNIEGYGTAILPFGTFSDVLLIHVEEAAQDVQDLGGMEFVSNSTNSIYALYKAGMPLPLAIFEELTFSDVQGTEVTYLGRTFNSSGGVSVGEEGVNQLNVYPNPTDGVVRVELGLEEIISLSLFTTDGKFVQNFSTAQGSSITLDMSGLPLGVYVLIAKGANEVRTTRVIRK